MSDKKPYNFVFYGIVGSGKGTQVELLQNYLKEKDSASETLLLSPGSEFRRIISGDSYTGELVKTKLEKGELQPNFLTISLCTNILINSLKPSMHIVADGYPRSIPQSEALMSAMDFYKREGVHVIYIEVGKEEAIRRMKLRARSDDTDEGITKRFEEYVNNVLPSFEYFKDKPGCTIHTINGEQSIEAVHTDIVKVLGI